MNGITPSIPSSPSARPGGNVTGISTMNTELTGMRPNQLAAPGSIYSAKLCRPRRHSAFFE
jgi:hypothetical protein